MPDNADMGFGQKGPLRGAGNSRFVQVAPADDKPMSDQEFREFLLNGPVFFAEEIASIEAASEGFRKWRL